MLVAKCTIITSRLQIYTLFFDLGIKKLDFGQKRGRKSSVADVYGLLKECGDIERLPL